MSSDLYVSDINFDTYGEMHLEMPVSMQLRITVIGIGNTEHVARFIIPNSVEGWNEAEKIVVAIQEWIRHTKQLSENKP